MTLLLAQLVFADTDGLGHMDGFGWGMVGIGWLFMLVIVGLVVWAVAHTTSNSRPQSDETTASAQRILAERFARGEIDDEEYRRRSDAMGR